MAKTGRKPLYDDWLTPDGLLKIKGWIRDDKLTEKDIYTNKIGISHNTWNTWKNNFEELRDTVKKAKEPVDIEIMDSFYKDLKGYYVEETTTEITIHRDADDNVVSKTEHKRNNKRWIAPNPSERIFYLKVQKGWKEYQSTFAGDTVEDDPLTVSLKEFAGTLESGDSNAD